MQDTPQQSPDFLPRPPKRGLGVRRLNRVPLLIAGAALAAVIGTIGYTYQLRASEQAGSDKPFTAQKPEPASAESVFDKAPEAGLIQPVAASPVSVPSDGSVQPIVPAVPTDGSVPVVTTTSTLVPAPMASPGMDWAAQERAQRQSAEAATRKAAFESPTTVYVKSASNGQSAGAASPLTGGVSLNQASSHYLPGTREEALSPYEIKAGTILPSIMIGGVNSDLPGQLVAAISENVYDSATGKHLLIPQGAKLVGTYEHQVAMGQRRVLIVWNRVLYPDGSSLNLGAMPGADQAGYAGFKDKTNNHLARIYGNAIVLSLITAAAQLSQPVQRQGDASYSSQQIIAGSLGLQLNQLGMQTLARGMNIAPTMEIRPGYRFNVMVTKDIILRPWPDEVSSLPKRAACR